MGRKSKRSCSNCAKKEQCEHPIKLKASDEELKIIVCFNHIKAEKKSGRK